MNIINIALLERKKLENYKMTKPEKFLRGILV